MNTELKILRIKNHLTQLQMAQQTGVSIATYNKIENGKRNGSKNFWLNVQKNFKLTDAEVWKLQK